MPSKYYSKKVKVDGIVFDSKKEADYYCQLRLLQKANIVKEFQMQVPFELQPKYRYKGKLVRAISYIADFVVTYADGKKEVIDVKGYRTKDYRLKKKMLLYKYPEMDFKEV